MNAASTSVSSKMGAEAHIVGAESHFKSNVWFSKWTQIPIWGTRTLTSRWIWTAKCSQTALWHSINSKSQNWYCLCCVHFQKHWLYNCLQSIKPYHTPFSKRSKTLRLRPKWKMKTKIWVERKAAEFLKVTLSYSTGCIWRSKFWAGPFMSFLFWYSKSGRNTFHCTDEFRHTVQPLRLFSSKCQFELSS